MSTQVICQLLACVGVGALIASCSRGPTQQPVQQPAAHSTPGSSPSAATPEATTMPTTAKVEKSDADWRKELSAEQYYVLREKGTERAYTGKYWQNEPGPGEYRCAGCQAVLFKGTDKFVSDCGWPAFDKAIKGTIDYHTDKTLGMVRTEVTCAKCGGHLGHVFEDGPTDTGIRYCINSVSIDYVPDAPANKDAPTEARGE